jgi:hypothetical protein
MKQKTRTEDREMNRASKRNLPWTGSSEGGAPGSPSRDFRLSEGGQFRNFLAGYNSQTMYPFFTWLEASALSDWVRSSPSMFAFPFILILHTVGMAFLVGANVAIDLRILGFAAGIPLSTLEKFFPVMWFGFVVNAVSGLLLLIGYPDKSAHQPGVLPEVDSDRRGFDGNVGHTKPGAAA